VFGADSAVESWTSHDDRASRTLRKLSPIAFWVPIAAVATTPVVWADEAQDGNAMNAQYARSATAALAFGFIASRTAKYFVHRARPCTGESPGVILVGTLPDSLPPCDKGSHVAGYTSFFSEHTVALFAIASAATFQAQRQNDRNAAPIAAVAFTGASVFSLGRIYQHQHWLSDVLVGAAVGTASGWLGAQLGPRSPR
jgi:membrane-associated phospholipid phosphatase